MRGPRRVGKSVEMKRAVRDLIGRGVSPRAIIHASCDGWRDSDLGTLVDVGRNVATRGIDGPRYWLLDEITGVTGDWPSRIKWLRDNTAMREDCVVLTGSSSRDLDASRKALAGRRGHATAPDRTLLPMSFRAFCLALDLPAAALPTPVDPRELMGVRAAGFLDDAFPWLDDLLAAWEAWLVVGGFPDCVDDYLRHGEVLPARTEMLWNIVRGDALRAPHLTEPQTLQFLLKLTAGLASPLNMSALARDVGVSMSVAKARWNDLVTTFLAWPCFLEDRGAPKLRAQHKGYFLDPALARLAAVRADRANVPPDLTLLSEQQLGVTLARRFEHDDPGSFLRFDSVMFARTSTKAEVDFVCSGEAVPIESKYVDGTWKRAAQTLRARFGRGIVATRSVLALDGDVWAVPAPLVALLIDTEVGD